LSTSCCCINQYAKFISCALCLRERRERHLCVVPVQVRRLERSLLLMAASRGNMHGMSKARWAPLAWWCGIVIAVWVTCWFVADWVVATPATAGDLFSSLAALFSGLAFAGVIYALRLQMEELALQREELRATRDELKRTAAAQEGTQTAVESQVRIGALSAMIDAANKEGGTLGVYGNDASLRTFERAVKELAELAGLPPLIDR
jgi:hypothetical protein